MNCLLAQEEQEAKTHQESLLARRLRLARSGEQADQAGQREEIKADEIRSFPVGVAREPVGVIQPEIREIDQVGVKPSPPPIAEAPERRKEESNLFFLIMEPTKRHIALPINGEIILGRPDPTVNFFPDIDLSYEGRLTISRRHAKISGDDKAHYIEDMGSTNGTRVNNQLLELGQKHRLCQGDRIAMGYCLFVYGPTPEWLINPPPHLDAQFYFLVTSSGQRIDLPDQGTLIIGRSDPALSFVPDVDLRHRSEASDRVARRHAKIICQGRTHSLEDLGSPYGIKINGTPVLLGQTIQLSPGDHVWFGGCVLAYEVEIKGSKYLQ